MIVLALAVGFLLGVAATLVLNRGSAERGRLATRERRFQEAMASEALPSPVVASTHAALAPAPESGRELRPLDRLGPDLGLGREDVEDRALVVVSRLDGRIPTAQELDGLGGEGATVREFARFVAGCVGGRAA